MDEREFENWCRSQEGKPLEKPLQFSEYESNRAGTNDELEAGFLSEIKSAFTEHKESLHISFGSNKKGFSKFRYDFSDLESPHHLLSQSSVHVQLLDINTPVLAELSDGAIGSLRISNPSKIIFVRNCFVAHLSVYRSTETDLTLQNCWVGQLELGTGSISSLVIDGGSIRSVKCPPTDGENPFTGSVLISRDVSLPVSKKWPLFPGPQPYRNLRVHLEKLQNVPAANLFRSRELRSERASEYGVNWIINWLYGTFSDYGARPEYALSWALAVYLVTAFVILIGDGGALGLPLESYIGWRSSLTIEEPLFVEFPRYPDVSKAEFRRSFILPLQSFVNPLGLFGSRNLVVAATGWGKILLAVQGLFCDALVLMAILGIRRRFRQR